MKTSIELNDEKVALAKKLGKPSSLKELVDHALDAYIQQARRHSMSELLGTDFFTESKSSQKENSRGRTRR